MLAYSLAQHRENKTEVPLMDALSIVMGDKPIWDGAGHKTQDELNRIINDGNKIYEEALVLVKAYMPEASRPSSLDEKRRQPRLQVSSLIKVCSPSSGQKWQGTLSNISWGGVRIRTKKPIGKKGDYLELFLPYHDGGDIEIMSNIVRSWEFGGMYNTSVRFSLLHPQDEPRIDNLLRLLLDSKDEKNRKHNRFAHRIDVTFWDIDELKSTLEDISKGGMMITMPDPVTLNESIQVQLEGTDEGYSLNLRAKVIRQDVVDISGLNMFQIALRFEHPTEELHSMVSTLMANIMNKGKM